MNALLYKDLNFVSFRRIFFIQFYFQNPEVQKLHPMRNIWKIWHHVKVYSIF